MYWSQMRLDVSNSSSELLLGLVASAVRKMLYLGDEQLAQTWISNITEIPEETLRQALQVMGKLHKSSNLLQI